MDATSTDHTAERYAEQHLSAQGFVIAAALAAHKKSFGSMGDVQGYLRLKGFGDELVYAGLCDLFAAQDADSVDDEPHVRLHRIVCAVAADDDTVDIPLVRVGDHWRGTFDASTFDGLRCAGNHTLPVGAALESFRLDHDDDKMYDNDWAACASYTFDEDLDEDVSVGANFDLEMNESAAIWRETDADWERAGCSMSIGSGLIPFDTAVRVPSSSAAPLPCCCRCCNRCNVDDGSGTDGTEKGCLNPITSRIIQGGDFTVGNGTGGESYR